MRQTIAALLFEGIIEVEKNPGTWRFTGITADGATVGYSCEAEEKFTFGRVQIAPNSIRREGEPCGSLPLLLEEIIENRLDGAHKASFIRELLETLAKDYQCRMHQPDRIPQQERHYEALESHMTDGHRYHPSYKSRIGFSLADNYAYGPEFNQALSLHWAAVNERLVDLALSRDYAGEEMDKRHLTEDDRRRFARILLEQGDREKKYVYVPVHPWQMEHVLPTVFVEQLAARDIVPLGPSDGSYRAQQSIRTLARRDRDDAPYLKLALSITNTSTSRILASHTTQNAPRISDWLHTLAQRDELLQKERFQLLREWKGISFRYEALPSVQYRAAYGTLGAIYRENVSMYLEEGEEAWPLNALFLTQKNGVPFLREAIDLHGIEVWSDALIRTVTLPIVHLLYAHGIALESHAQNIILVVKDRLPTRIIVKDLHDGVRYAPDKLLRPEWAPELIPEPETHRKFNRYSFLRTEAASEVRDYTLDAFFFICMTDICFALEPFGLGEQEFWRKCASTIVGYQTAYPEHKDRYEWFDLFAEDAQIEEMTKRRIYGDGELYFRRANNPLRAARDSLP